jgi:1-acyl-sn-glycerol-3-phosphate acyltransferase
MYELMQLTGQEYVDMYAAKVKQQTGANLGFGATPVLAQVDPVDAKAGSDRWPIERVG